NSAVDCFAGSMRRDLIGILDVCGIPNSSHLYGTNRNFLHTTSIIKYPLFIKGKNYTEHQPPIDRSSLLRHYAYAEFPAELTHITPPSLIIPLGKTADHVISRLAKEDKLPNHTYLTGFPHPSGANGHRVRQLQRQREQLLEKVKTWRMG